MIEGSDNGRLSDFGKERAEEIYRRRAEEIDARNTKLRYWAALGLGFLNLGAFLGIVVAIIGFVYALWVGASPTQFAIGAVVYLAVAYATNRLMKRVDNPDLKVGD